MAASGVVVLGGILGSIGGYMMWDIKIIILSENGEWIESLITCEWLLKLITIREIFTSTSSRLNNQIIEFLTRRSRFYEKELFIISIRRRSHVTVNITTNYRYVNYIGRNRSNLAVNTRLYV